ACSWQANRVTEHFSPRVEGCSEPCPSTLLGTVSSSNRRGTQCASSISFDVQIKVSMSESLKILMLA
ncbi:MAG: hypothetical protein ABI955_06260, partial [Nitrospirota bacterium]